MHTSADPFGVSQTFLASRTGRTETCEDFIAVGEHWVGVVDGATDKTGRLLDGETGGRVAARAVAQALETAGDLDFAGDLIDHLNRGYHAALSDHIAGVPLADRPTCVFVAVNVRSGLVVRVGDCSWATPERDEAGSMRIDDVTTGMRAAYLRMLLLEGADPETLARDNPGWDLIFPVLRLQGQLRNNAAAGDLAFAALDGTSLPAQFVESWQLAPTENEVALASDGYPRLFLLLTECEDYLAKDLAEDPLRIGRHPGFKTVPADMVSFDDRSFVRLERRPPSV